MPTKAIGIWQRVLIPCSLLGTVAIGIVAAQQPAQKAIPAPPVIRVMGGGQVIINGQGFAVGQGQDGTKDTNNQRVKLPVDPRARRKIEEARRFIETQDWQSAVMILQSLLNANEDNFLQEVDGDKGRRVSVRAEANRLLGSLPAEGKRIYEQQFGSAAKIELKQAKAQASPQLMANVALKYVHTESGAEAATWLGAYHLDNGRYIVAALCFDRLLSRDASATGVSLNTLYKAAIAFERAGDSVNRDRTWKMIQVKLNQPGERLPAAIRSWDETRLKTSLKAVDGTRSSMGENEWRLFMGSPDRAARSNTTAPFLEPSFPAISLVESAPARNEIEQANKKMFSFGVPVIPGSHPLVARDRVVFRTLDGVHAYHLKTGREAWNSHSDASFVNALRQQGNADPEAFNYLSSYRETAPTILLENTLLGTLSADNELVYAVEDLAIPPNVQSYGPVWGRGIRSFPQNNNSLGHFNSCNRLLALDLEEGRVVWSIGTHLPDQAFSDMFFLGPPLPLGDKLYVLSEVNAEIKLLCLQNRKTLKTNPKPGDEYDYAVDLVWSQPLGVVDRKITEDPVRRSQAAMLAYSDGILVCPTNAGSVVGVDLLTRSLVWAYSYQNEAVSTDTDTDRINFRIRGRVNIPSESPAKGGQWSYAAPIISQGMVLLAPSDGTALHAINLRDGTVAWTSNRVDTASKVPLPPDCYLAGVFENLVLLAGKQNLHTLDLKTGKPVWNVMTGMPCGRGVANEDTYFMPVRGNEIISIAMKTGQVVTRSKARHKEALGNLALIGEHFVSLNHNNLLIYPIQAVKEQQVAERLKANPKDPIGLVDRGDLLWHRGQVEAAISDFRQALQNKPDLPLKNKAEAKLADTLLTMFEKDFVKNEPLLGELERLTVPVSLDAASADDRNALLDRKVRYYRMLAKGREAQGRIEDALAAYQAFAQLDDKIIVSPDDPLVRILPKVWALAQAQLMAKRLTTESKGKLDQIVQKQWEQVRADKNPEAIRAFVDFYGELSTTGQNAQLFYAETQIENKEYAAALLRLLPLIDVNDSGVSAKALDALARLNIRMGELENAAYYYRMLAKRHPKVVVRDGKSGVQLYQELTTDKRFLPYLDERQGLSNLQNMSIEKLEFTRKYNNTGLNNYVTNFEAACELPPQLRKYGLQVSIDQQTSFRCSYAVRDLIQKKDVHSKWSFAIPTINYGYQERVWPSYQMAGNIMVFSWANRVVGVDLGKKAEAWSINVLGEGAGNDNAPNGSQLIPVPSMPGRFQVSHANGSFEVLGTYGPGSSKQLVLTVRHEGLVCINPQTGDKLWTRFGIAAGSEMFGDNDYVIVIPAKTGRNLEDQAMAVRMLDGQAMALSRQVEEDYRSSVARNGRQLLCRKPISADRDELQLIDPVTEGEAKIVWRYSMPTNTTLVKSALPSGLIGLLSGNGTFSVFDVASGQPQFQTSLNLSYQDYAAAHFIMDEKECYVFLCKTLYRSSGLGENAKAFESTPVIGLIQAGAESISGDRIELFAAYQWLRSIPVHGPVLCLQRETGNTIWQEDFPLQYVVLQRFHELPVLLCSAITMKVPPQNNNVNVRMVGIQPNFVVGMRNGKLNHELALFSKQTGKIVPLPDKGAQDYESPYEGRRVRNNMGFQELLIESQTGKVELKSALESISFHLAPVTLATTQK